jgi:hypothetical protein
VAEYFSFRFFGSDKFHGRLIPRAAACNLADGLEDIRVARTAAKVT